MRQDLGCQCPSRCQEKLLCHGLCRYTIPFTVEHLLSSACHNPESLRNSLQQLRTVNIAAPLVYLLHKVSYRERSMTPSGRGDDSEHTNGASDYWKRYRSWSVAALRAIGFRWTTCRADIEPSGIYFTAMGILAFMWWNNLTWTHSGIEVSWHIFQLMHFESSLRLDQNYINWCSC